MKIELSGEERSIIAVYLTSFEEYYIAAKKKDIAKKFNRVKSKFLKNNDKPDAKKGDWSFIVRALLEGKRLINEKTPDLDTIIDEKEREETKTSMEYAVNNINSALKKIQEAI